MTRPMTANEEALEDELATVRERLAAMTERAEKAEAEVARLKAIEHRLMGLIHSEVVADMHYCEVHEMSFQSAVGAPVECPYCVADRLSKQVDDWKAAW